ncbi:MAG: hypothetical protein U9N35_08800 [Euryarchaeota archaeon]|nr:hypothetical protein [Euryarchaeota archaeon]
MEKIDKRRKIGSILVAAVMLAATLGTVSAENQKTYARNPSIQNSKYYMLEFSIESNAEKAFLILDGEEQKMHREGENYVCRTSFGDGDHEYYFLLDKTRFPKRGSYRITEVERRWILLSSLVGYLTWKPVGEQRLGNKEILTKDQELYQTWIIKSEAAASISGLTKRMAVTSPEAPQNFDVSQVMRSLKITDLGKGRTFEINIGKNLLDLSQSAYAFALESAKRAETLSAKCSHDTSEKITAHDIKELARKFGYKAESALKQEETEGYSVIELYTSAHISPHTENWYNGREYSLQIDAFWGHPSVWWAPDSWVMDYDINIHAAVQPGYDVDQLTVQSATVAGEPVFVAKTAGGNNVSQAYDHRHARHINPYKNFLTTVNVSARFKDYQELPPDDNYAINLEILFEMGY